VDDERGGKRFAVNGRDYASKSEEEEAALEGHLEKCVDKKAPQLSTQPAR